MKTVEWVHPDKMRFESDHHTFNQQTSFLIAGNAVMPTQYSTYVRPAQETESNGESFEEAPRF